MRMRNRKATSDFTKSMLPQNRREVFFDVLKIHWRKLLMLGVLFFVVFIPYFWLLWIGDAQQLQIDGMSAQLTQQQLQEANYNLATASNIRNAVALVWWLLFGVVMAGMSRVIRQYAWEENVNFFSDFIKGIRDNAKSTMILAFIVGLMVFMCSGTYHMIGFGPSYLPWISAVQIVVALLVVFPVCAIWYAMIPLYQNTTVKYALFSFAVYLKSIIKTLITLYACLVILVPILLPMPFFHVIGLFIVSFLLPFVLLIWNLYSYSLFDAYINPRYYPELIGKGILGKAEDQENDVN